MRHFDVIVVGAGAAGVMAAGVAAREGKSVLLCEKMEKPLRKVRITGKGRCNLTNMHQMEEFMTKVRSGAEFFRPAFEGLSNLKTVEFFEQIGVPLHVERGKRVFPASNRAWDIADAHTRWCKEQGAKIECNTRVRFIRTQNSKIGPSNSTVQEEKNPSGEGSAKGRKVKSLIIEAVNGQEEEVSCSHVILATGGASYPATGSTGDGYRLAHELGHTIESIRPSLTPLVLGIDLRSIQGLMLRNISTTLMINNEPALREFGELEFTPTGVGGAVVLRLSRRAVDALIDGERCELEIDLKPALSTEQLLARLGREQEVLTGEASVKDVMARLLPAVLVAPFLRVVAVELRQPLASLSDRERQSIVEGLKAFRLPITDYRPFEEAIVTAGGVSLSEIDPETLESKVIEGLYFAGEVMDIDADTGGYNLQIAYSTGNLAGKLK